MSIRNTATFGASGPPTSADHNQPMDLAQKSHSTKTPEFTSIAKGGTTLVQLGSSQLVSTSASTLPGNTKASMSGEISLSGTLFSRQSSQGALNLVASGSTNSSSLNATVSGRASSASLPSSGYHIPRGPAVVANMTASRSQNLSSIIRTTSQVIGVSSASAITSSRASIISQRVIPVSNSNWINRNAPTTAIITTKAPTGHLTGRATITSGRSSQSSTVPVSSYQGGTLKSGGVVAGTIRSHISSAVRVGVSVDGARPHTPKGIQISHPISHTPRFVGATGTGTVRGVGNTTFVTPGSIGGNTVYTPTSTLVTSLASSGTTITPHPGNRNHPPNAVRFTPAASVLSPNAIESSHATALSGICLTPSSSGTILTHHPSSLTRSAEHLAIKTPIVRSTHPITQGHGMKENTTSLPAGTHISFSGPKVIQTSGTPLALAQLSNVVGSKTQGAILSTQAGLSSRPGTTVVAPTVGRGSGPTISMAKVINQRKGMVGQGSTTTIPISHITSSLSSNSPTDPQTTHTSVFLQRAAHAVTVAQPEKTMVTQYSIATPYYLESGNQATSLPVNASIVPSNHYIPSGTVNAGSVRIGGGGSTNSVCMGVSDVSNVSMPLIKTNSSPRPSILRKRTDTESIPAKAAKNLSAALNIPMSSPPSPGRPDSRGNGNISSGSTTISANSSPGMQINEDDSSNGNMKLLSDCKSELSHDIGTSSTASQPCVINVPLTSRSANASVVSFIEAAVVNSLAEKGEPPYHSLPPSQPPDGISPRKKPRKQTLMGNELLEPRPSEELFDQPVIKKVKKETPIPLKKVRPPESDEEKDNSCESLPVRKHITEIVRRESSPSPEPVLKKPRMSLLDGHRQPWKSRHNHFTKHSDVRPKEEKKRTVNEIANQKMALQRVNGWKVVHLSGQVEDLVDVESEINQRLQGLLNTIEKRQQFRKPYKEFEKDVNRLSELFKANMQRSVIIKDQMTEAKSQMSKIFNHKDNIVNILTKFGNKRTLRKKEKF